MKFIPLRIAALPVSSSVMLPIVTLTARTNKYDIHRAESKRAKKLRKTGRSSFSQKHVFHYFKWNWGGLGVFGGRGRTIRIDSLELWQGLVLHGIGEIDFHVFWKYWKLTSSPNTSKLVLGPPDWSSDFFESQGTISGAIK